MEKEKSSEEQPLIFQFVANNISFRLIFIIAISRDSNSEEINEIPWCFTLWEKEKKHSFQIPCNFPNLFFFTNYCCSHNHKNPSFWRKKPHFSNYQQLNFSAKMQWYATSHFDVIRENSNWIHFVVQSLVNLRIIFRILYFETCTFKIEFSGQKLEFCSVLQ